MLSSGPVMGHNAWGITISSWEGVWADTRPHRAPNVRAVTMMTRKVWPGGDIPRPHSDGAELPG